MNQCSSILRETVRTWRWKHRRACNRTRCNRRDFRGLSFKNLLSQGRIGFIIRHGVATADISGPGFVLVGSTGFRLLRAGCCHRRFHLPLRTPARVPSGWIRPTWFTNRCAGDLTVDGFAADVHLDDGATGSKPDSHRPRCFGKHGSGRSTGRRERTSALGRKPRHDPVVRKRLANI